MGTDDDTASWLRRKWDSVRLANPRALALVALLTLLWGTNWPIVPIVVREIPVWTFRAIATIGGGVILLGAARVRGQPLAIPREYWLTVGASAILHLAVWNVASTYSAILIPSGQAAVLSYTMPFWAALITWAVFGQRPRGRMVLAIALAAAAVVLLMVPNFGVYARAPLGLALGLLAGLGWAVGTLIIKHRAPPVPATVLAGWQLVLAGVPIAIGALLLGDGSAHVLSWQSVALMAYIVLVPMAVGNLCWFAIVGMLPASVAGVSSILVLVVALVSGAIVHGEPLGALQWLAMACSVAALSLSLTGGGSAKRSG